MKKNNKNQISWLKNYLDFTNYLSTAMLYLKENQLLEKQLHKDQIKPRILGHWGTVPGINLLYGALNILIKEQIKNDFETAFVLGPGHGAPAFISGLFLEGTLEKYYPKATLDKKGIEYVTKQFSWPSGFPSHTWPGLPGSIHEGGELGYSLATAYGSVFDNPNLITFCLVGDGEAETGTLSASWQSNKFLDHKKDGVVLPILHLNGYKISGPTLFATMSDEEIAAYFIGLDYKPYFINQYELGEGIYEAFLATLELIYQDIKSYKEDSGQIPVIILKTKKGWTGPDKVNGVVIEDNNKSHGIPLQHPTTNVNEFLALKEWLKSYKFNRFITDEGKIVEELQEFIPKENLRIGSSKYASGNPGRLDLNLPNLNEHGHKVSERGHRPDSLMEEVSEYLRDLLKRNSKEDNFRIFSPDESESNVLEPLFDVTGRKINRKLRKHDKFYSSDGKIMEILSENVLQGWFEGYLKTGRHGIFISYEAFLNIITSQIDQYIKYLRQSFEISWRKPVSSMNIIATSTGWRQDHNGFTHQNPSLINSLIIKQADFVSVYFPADVNIMLATTADCLKRTDAVNLIVSGKRELPQWLTMEEAKEHVRKGISLWEWASNKRDLLSNLDSEEDQVDIVLASAGDYQTQETLAAAQILKEMVPQLNFQYVNVNEITRLGMGDEEDPVLTSFDFEKYFTKNKEVIFNFHGYPETIKQITWGREISNRITILGYIEKGTTTTPFDMQVLNEASRYHVCINAIIAAAKVNPIVENLKDELIDYFEELLSKHKRYIVENGEDMPEVRNFKFKF